MASGAWLTNDRVRIIASMLILGMVLALGWQWLGGPATLDPMGRPIGTDFSGVYSAGLMVLQGQPADAWDWSLHRHVQELVHHKAGVDFYGWHYPPPFLLIAAALATMPYLPALALWQSVTLAACVATVVRICPGRPTMLLALAAPATGICLMHGHNGFLTGTLLGLGLLVLDRRPLLAGLLLGALVYKPQFALLIGPLLLVTGNWRALGGALLGAGGLIAVTLLLWGWPVWGAFLDSLDLTRRVVIEAGNTGFNKIVSPFAALRMWGAPLPLAYGAQLVATVGAVGAALWTAVYARPALRNAAVAAATVISTPYVLDYDLVVVGVGIAFFVADAHRRGWLAWEKTALALVWAAPLFGRGVAQWTLVPLNLMSAMLLLAVVLRRAIRDRAVALQPSTP
jgi:hypothetical protein